MVKKAPNYYLRAKVLILIILPLLYNYLYRDYHGPPSGVKSR